MEFKQFDIVTDDVSDHHYAGANNGGKGFTQIVIKKIMKEWKILQENLPESIFVRVYEGRIDLLRAVIIGSPGTPYYNGLFFLDFCIPSDYPAQPPKVHYRSFHMRMNPNLYNNGTVCLSLLNTWTGKKEEKWNSSQSTLLQVLVSIQALVLNEKPYLNEPGTGASAGTYFIERYNQKIWVNSCKTMKFLLNQPPSHFKEFIVDHFRTHAQSILSACQAYVDGRVRVGHLVENGTSSSHSYRLSKKFETAMLSICPQLLESFELAGADVQNFRAEYLFQLRSSPVGKKKDGIVKKTINKLKMIFGWPKKVASKKEEIQTM